MAIEKSDNITIVGAGMAGTLLAILMARRGFRIDLFEQHPDPRSGDGCLQLCSNLALGERARYALRITGLLRQVEALSTQMRGRLIHDRAGNVTEQPYGYRDYETLYSVRRESLQQCLLNEAELHPEIRVHFDRRLRSVDWSGKTAVFSHNGDAELHHQRFDVLIGADGATSGVRRALQDGYREQVKLATKMPVWLIESANDFDRYLDEQLERLQTDHIDFYLLHGLSQARWPTIRDLNVFGWAEGAIADGRIRHLGFSFHGGKVGDGSAGESLLYTSIIPAAAYAAEKGVAVRDCPAETG